MRSNKVHDGQQRAISWLHDILTNALQFEHTHEQILQGFSRLHETDWFKALPQYARSYVRGYQECLFGSRNYKSELNQALTTAHLYNGELYTNFMEWRKDNPEHPGGEIGPCVSVWRKSGKVHSAYKDKPDEGEIVTPDSELLGKTFPWRHDRK